MKLCRCTLLFAALLLAAVAPAQAAEQALEGRLVNLPIVFECDTPEELGRHKICNYRIQGVAIAKDGAVAQRTIRGTLAFIKGVGPVQSYAIWTYADGSTLVMEAHGASKMNAQGKVVVEGVQTCVAATGRFAGGQCQMNWSVSQVKGGFFEGTYKGTITLPD
ncbi:MAG: hypothetical protein AAF495_15405 [Pseudomonadota bacterium]